MQLSVYHSTVYRYAEQASRSTQYIRLAPYASARQRVLDWQLELPAPALTMSDAFDNLTHVLTLDVAHQEIRLVARGRVDVDEVDDGEPVGRLNPMVFLRATPLTEADDELRAFVDPMRRTVVSRPLIGTTDLMNAVLDRMPYTKGITAVHFSAAEAFKAGAGVCQDHSHVFIACCRALGIPARYVSGYVYSTDLEQVASHAWAEAWLMNRWVSFDISNARHAGGAHIKLAIGLDYLDACPVRGVRLGGGDENLSTLAHVKAHQQ
ncbi:MAG: transglutaminase family protein [Burkholderiales bacterium]|nr:transglutaminase family protein [Burkholderiales bacterium]